MTLFHFTDTARLPWIVASGELRRGDNRLGDYPVDFLWATTSDKGDPTAAWACKRGRKAYREGRSRQVRFTLDREDFAPWRDIVGRFSEWTPKYIATLESSGRKMGADPAAWGRRSTRFL